MAISAGKVFIDVLANMSGFDKGVSAGVQKTLGSIQQKAGQLGRTLTKSVTLPIIGIGVAAFNSASDLNESLSKVQVVFGDLSEEVVKWSETSAEAFGTSQQAALEAAGTYGNLFQAFGVGRKSATKMSTTLVQLAADLASFNNTSIEDALLALRSGLSGETEPLKRFGIAINDARLKAEALKLGLIDNTKEALEPGVKAQAAYALIMKDSTLAQGDFARTSDGAANKLRILRAKLGDTLATLGTELIPVVQDAADVVMELIDSWKALSPEVKKTILKTLLTAAAVGPVLSAISKVAGAIKGLIGLYKGLKTVVTAARTAQAIETVVGVAGSTATAGAGAAATATGTAATAAAATSLAGPLLVLGASVLAIIGGFVWFNNETGKAKDSIRSFSGTIEEWRKTQHTNSASISKAESEYRHAQEELVRSVKFSDTELEHWAKTLVKGNTLSEQETSRTLGRIRTLEMFGFALDDNKQKQIENLLAVGDVTRANQLLKGWIREVTNKLKPLASAIQNATSSARNFANSIPSGIGGRRIQPPPAFAAGGIVRKPIVGLVGEAGPEAIIPLSQLGTVMGGGRLEIVDWRRGIATLSRELDYSVFSRGE